MAHVSGHLIFTANQRILMKFNIMFLGKRLSGWELIITSNA
jgi:hypothetical protein